MWSAQGPAPCSTAVRRSVSGPAGNSGFRQAAVVTSYSEEQTL